MPDMRKVRMIKKVEPPAELLDSVMARIQSERLREVKTRFWLSSGIALLSLLLLVPALREFNAEAVQSGFSQFSSLLFSDGGIIGAYSQDFAMALAESLPAFGVSLVSSVIFLLLFSLRNIRKDMQIVFGSGFVRSAV